MKNIFGESFFPTKKDLEKMPIKDESPEEEVVRVNRMKPYSLLLKSHSAYPDYEDECLATNKEEAAEVFHERLRGWEAKAEWSPENLMPFIGEDDHDI